jgi:hypothetical protein
VAVWPGAWIEAPRLTVSTHWGLDAHLMIRLAIKGTAQYEGQV